MQLKQNDICTYYNVPKLSGKLQSPATVAGIVLQKTAQDQTYARIVIHRNISVPLESFTVLYRCSAQSVRVRDPENPFVSLVYDRPDINQKEYISLRIQIQENVDFRGIVALVSSVILESGERRVFRAADYQDPKVLCAGADIKKVDPLLSAYFAGTSAAAAEKSSSAPQRKFRGWLPEYSVGIATAVLLIGIIGFAIFKALTALLNTGEATLDKTLATMMEEKRYSEAYHLVAGLEDDSELSATCKETLQLICENAASYYLTQRDYEKAHLYAVAAPAPFDGEVIDAFLTYFIEINRVEEAYTFLKEQTDYAEATQRALIATVKQYLTEQDYENAVLYAKEVELNQKDILFEEAIGVFSQTGELTEEAWDALVQMNEGADMDALILQTAGRMTDSYGALLLLTKLEDENARNQKIAEACVKGMKVYADAHSLGEAYRLFEKASTYMDTVQKTDCLDRLADYCYMRGNTAGNMYFRYLLGEDISLHSIETGDTSIRDSAADVYFLLSEQQKRIYHAVSFDLYKEAYLIEDGVLLGTDIADAMSVCTFEYQTVVLHTDGSVSAIDNDGHNRVIALPEEKGVVQIAAGLGHVLMLHNDGTVSAAGSNTYGQGNVDGWETIIKVAAGADFSVGLKADGTVVACGSNSSRQCDVSAYVDVCDIAACDQSTVLLFRDGSVKVIGDVSAGLKRADSFTDVRKIRACATTIVAEKKDGGYLMASGVINGDSGSVGIWENAKEFAAGSVCVGYVDASGRIHIDGDGKPTSAS